MGMIKSRIQADFYFEKNVDETLEFQFYLQKRSHRPNLGVELAGAEPNANLMHRHPLN